MANGQTNQNTPFFNPDPISQQDYLSGPVDFYSQSLGQSTGIQVTDPDDDKDEEKEEDTAPNIFAPIGSGGDDKQQAASDISRQLTGGLSDTKLFSAAELNPQSFNYNPKTGGVNTTSYKGDPNGKTLDLVSDFANNFMDNLASIKGQSLESISSPLASLGKSPTLISPTGRKSAMGLPPAATLAIGPVGAGIAALAAIGGAANMALAQQTAAQIKATGGGAFMENSGAMLYRKPGSTMYSGSLVGNSQKMSGYLEAMQRGIVRGTMKIETFDPATGRLKDDVSGVRDVVSRDGLIGSQGGFTETGAWMDLAGNTSTGTVAKQTEAYTAAVNQNFGLTGSYSITKAELMGLREKVNTSWSFTKGTHVTPGSKTYQDLVRDLVAEKQKQKDIVQDRQLGYMSGARGEEDITFAEARKEQSLIDQMTSKGRLGKTTGNPELDAYIEQQVQKQKADFATEEARKAAAEQKRQAEAVRASMVDARIDREIRDDIGDQDYSRATGVDRGNYGETEDYKLGGRVGMQAGGETGFAQRPEFVGGNETPTDRQSIADDKPREVPEGTFVINAAAVDFAGREDIEKMVREAYAKAGQSGKAGTAQEVDIAVSEGEVIIPPRIAKIIGYDRLNKINNRGKKEISRRQAEREQKEAAGGGFISRKKFAKGDKVVPRSNPQRKKEALADVELRADLEEYMQNDNLARLGFNLYEKGLLDINAIVLPRRAKEDMNVLTGGMYTPSKASRGVQARRVATGDDRRMMDMAESQGVKIDMRKPSGGISYFVNEGSNYTREDANLILIHELRHAALDYIANTYNIPEDKRLTISREEHLFDAQDYMNRKQARKVKPSIPKTYGSGYKEDRSSAAASLSSTRKQLQMYQDLAQKVLQDRKVPKRTKSKEVEGFVTRGMKLLGL